MHSPELSAEASTAAVASSAGAKFAASTAFEAGDAPCSGFDPDREGFIWLGTRSKGLLRFDGQKLSYLQSGATGIPGNSACQLFQDSDGKIWISTEAGLDIF